MCIDPSSVHACLILSQLAQELQRKMVAFSFRLSSLFTATSARCAHHRHAATDKRWPDPHLTNHESRTAVLGSMPLLVAGCDGYTGALLQSRLQLCEQRL